jgi:putative transposase
VISDAHSGLVSALTQAISGSAWQRCTVHLTHALALSAGVRNVLAPIAHRDKKQVADAIKLIFEQPNYSTTLCYLKHLIAAMHKYWLKAA